MQIPRNTRTQIHKYTDTNRRTDTQAHTQTHTGIHRHRHRHRHTHTHTHKHTHTHTQTHTHTHTHAHTHTHTRVLEEYSSPPSHPSQIIIVAVYSGSTVGSIGVAKVASAGLSSLWRRMTWVVMRENALADKVKVESDNEHC
jgi:hypothetical protein